jgi:hypothetical protein
MTRTWRRPPRHDPRLTPAAPGLTTEGRQGRQGRAGHARATAGNRSYLSDLRR